MRVCVCVCARAHEQKKQLKIEYILRINNKQQTFLRNPFHVHSSKNYVLEMILFKLLSLSFEYLGELEIGITIYI